MTSPVGEDDLMAWIDGRLPPERKAMVDDFLVEKPELRARLLEQAGHARKLAAAFAPVAAEPIPASMRVSAIQERRGKPGWRIALAASLLLSAGFGGGWISALQTVPAHAGIASLAQEATDNYRVFAADRLSPVQIAPGDRDGLIRVASARLGSPVAIPDLSRSGFRYAGGQLIATPHGPATLFIYHGANNARLALLTRPMQVDKTAPMAVTAEGDVGRVSWAVNGMGYSVVSDRSIEELHPIANEVRRQLLRT